MWLTSSSIGRKFVMAITGACLVLFVTFHVLMNSVALFWPAAYNVVCEFLGANWYALVKDIILAEKKRGKTIIITTHNMYDATELCDQVAFIVAGKVSALDSPHNLIMSRGAAKIQYTYYDKGEKTGECLLDRTTEDKLLKSLISENRLLSIHSSEPTLNDIFVDITGRTLQ